MSPQLDCAFLKGKDCFLFLFWGKRTLTQGQGMGPVEFSGEGKVSTFFPLYRSLITISESLVKRTWLWKVVLRRPIGLGLTEEIGIFILKRWKWKENIMKRYKMWEREGMVQMYFVIFLCHRTRGHPRKVQWDKFRIPDESSYLSSQYAPGLRHTLP